MAGSFTHTSEKDIGHINRSPPQTVVVAAIWEFFRTVKQREQQDLLVLGRAIREIRQERGMAVEQLAQVSGVVRARIQALELGQLNPRYELLLALAEGLGVRPSAFVIRAEELAVRDQA
jgi:DNA-binding XRE family transcriptional regulator